MEYERPTFPELKIWHPLKTIKMWGRKIVEIVGMKEPPMYTSDHYRPPVTDNQLTFNYECDGGDLPLGDYPPLTMDDLPKLSPPENRWDDQGTYLDRL